MRTVPRTSRTRHSSPELSGAICFAFFVVAILVGMGLTGAIEVHPDQESPTDLALTGVIEGDSSREIRFLRWSELRKLPTSKLKLSGEFVPGEQEVTIVYLSDLWQVLPRSAGADTLLARCADGYASVYRADFIAKYKPYLVLEINGKGPDSWPPPGLKFNPGPYVISVSSEVAPAVASLLDAGHKKPWGVTSIELARYDDCFSSILSGPYATLSARATEGREIWINSCASCHAGPANTFGGTKSGRPFEFVASQARHNPAYFKAYVRDPKSIVSIAKMEPHPHYSDAQLDALIAFLVAEQAK